MSRTRIPRLNSFNGVTSGTFSVPTGGHELDSSTGFQFILTVTDSDGLQASAAVMMFARHRQSLIRHGAIGTDDSYRQSSADDADHQLQHRQKLPAANDRQFASVGQRE